MKAGRVTARERGSGMTTALPASMPPAAESDGLSRAVARLVAEGRLVACLPVMAGGEGLGTGTTGESVLATADLLRTLGRRDLALARLFEGHVNAVKLIELYAGPALREETRRRVHAGSLLGVWGATGADPLRVVTTDDDAWSLKGAKVFASGLGLVDLAIVPVPDPGRDGASRLLVIDVDDAARQHPQDWRASGMRSTRSGSYRFDGLRLPVCRVLGDPDVYGREPWFEGGVWRYVAAHVGGMEALVDALVAELLARAREDDPHQRARIGQAAALALGGRTFVERAALDVELADPADEVAVQRAVALALLARESVESAATELLALVERALGMAAFERGSPIERLRRDLGLYLRQAAPDAKLARAAATVIGSDQGIGTWW